MIYNNLCTTIMSNISRDILKFKRRRGKLDRDEINFTKKFLNKSWIATSHNCRQLIIFVGFIRADESRFKIKQKKLASH